MFCGQCGNKMSDTAKFCTKCGWKAGGEVKTDTTPGNAVISVPEAKAQENGDSNAPKKKSNLWFWILLIILVLGLGATATVLYLEYTESEEDEDDEDRDDEDEDRDKDDDEEDDDDSSDGGGLAGAYGEYVEKSEIVLTVQMIGSTMDALTILAVDPEIPWEIGEVVYVKFTADGIVYGSDNDAVISNMRSIMGDNTAVKQWSGFEIWAKKDSTGWIEFATSWDYDEMAEISPSFADRFSMTSVEP